MIDLLKISILREIVKPPIDYAADKLYSISDSVSNCCNWVYGILLFKDVGHTFVKKCLTIAFFKFNCTIFLLLIYDCNK